MAPHRSFVARPHWLKRRMANNVHQLTFDDGPHPEYTPRVLDLLAESGIQATFFVIGQNVERYPDIARRIVAEGHAIGNHSYSHPRFRLWEWSKPYEEFERASKVIAEVTGVVPTLIRPPFGVLTPGVIAAARRLNAKPQYWTLDSNDWQCRSEADTICCGEELRNAIELRDVVLLHDNHEYIEHILKVILDEPGASATGVNTTNSSTPVAHAPGSPIS